MTNPPFFVRWLQEAPACLDDVISRVEAERQRIRSDDGLSAQGKYEALAELRKWAELQVDAILTRAREAETSSERHVAVALRPSATATERLLQESEEQRAWARVRPLLEAGTDASELIARAGEAGDVATLRALRAELPAWREATVAAAAGEFDRPDTRRAAREGVEPLLEAIDRAEAPHLPRQQREALEIKFQTQALGDVVRAKQLVVDAVLNDGNVGRALIAAGFAQDIAERGLVGSSAGGEM